MSICRGTHGRSGQQPVISLSRLPLLDEHFDDSVLPSLPASTHSWDPSNSCGSVDILSLHALGVVSQDNIGLSFLSSFSWRRFFSVRINLIAPTIRMTIIAAMAATRPAYAPLLKPTEVLASEDIGSEVAPTLDVVTGPVVTFEELGIVLVGNGVC